MKRPITLSSIGHVIGFSVSSLTRVAALLSALALLSGCVGMMADSIGRSQVTGKTYGKIAATLTPPPNGSGRLFIYRTESSTKSSLQYGIGIVKNPTLCTVDDAVYEIIWEAFRYIDLPEGEHLVTCGKDVIKDKKGFVWTLHYQRGENTIPISIPNGAEVFVEVKAIEEDPYFMPVLVESAKGREDIFDLQYQKRGGHKFQDGEISRQ